MKTRKLIKIIIITLIILLIVLVSLIMNIISLNKSSSNINSGSKAGIDTSSKDKTKSEVAIENNEVIEKEDISINSIVLKQLTINSWDRVKAQLSTGYTIDENGNYVHDEGFTLYCDSTNVQNIIFNTNYQDYVLGSIKVGDSLEYIEETLGTPTFKDKTLGMIGYKTKEVYVFFYEDEISIYPNKKLNNINFEEDLFTYLSGTYSGNRTNFVVEIKRNYTDFTAVQDGADVILRSINRQIEIRLDENKNAEVTLYNGYNYGSSMNENIDNSNIKVEKIDLAEKEESERKLAE